MRGPTTLFVCVALAAVAAPMAGCGESTRTSRATAPTPAGPPARAADERVRFMFAISGRPAAGLVATFPAAAAEATAAAPPQLLDAEGGIALPAGPHGLRLVDPTSGLVLFAAGSRAALDEQRADHPDRGIRLPSPVRLVGRLALDANAGFRGPVERLELHVGAGPRLSVADYASRAHARIAQPLPGLPLDENRAWGLPLPSISSSWQTVRPRADGSFDAGWLALTAAPQLIATDGAGQLATLEVPLPAGLGPRATLDAGAIAPQPTVTLELDRAALPATALPLLLQASLDGAAVSPTDADAAALRLALLHRLEPRAAAFAMKRRPFDLELRGLTRIAGLPRFTRLELRVAGPRPGLLVRRTLTAPAAAAPSAASPSAVARVELSAAELLGAPRKIPLVGRVRFSDGSPAAGATVVYGSYPDRRETRTDRTGAFSLPAVAAGREVVIFVDAPSGGEPPFDRATASQRLEISADQPRVQLELTVPRPSPSFTSGAGLVSCPGGQAANVTDPIPYQIAPCSAITQSEELAYCPIAAAYLGQEPVAVEVSDLQVNPVGGEAWARLRLATPGTYNFLLSYTPFVYALTTVEVPTTDFVTVQFMPPAPWPTAVLVAANSFGGPAADTDIAFPNWVYNADPYNGLTDANGAMIVNCFNMNPVDTFVDSDQGCYQGPVDLRARGANLTLGSCQGF